MPPTEQTQCDTAFTPEIDRRILEGYLGDRRTMIEELGRAGITEEAIVKRGEALGLSTSFLSMSQTGRVNLAIRQCLTCEQAFASFGPQNRLCKRCRQRG